MSDEFEFMDSKGYLRRPGSLILPEDFVCSFPPYAGDAETPIWDAADIDRVISDPNRRDITKIFPSKQFIVNQYSTSACNGWAAANAVTRCRRLWGINDGWVGSGSYIYSKINGGRDAGSQLLAGLEAVQKYGVPSIKTVPYDKIYPRLYSQSADTEAKNNLGFNAYRALTREAWDTGLATGYMGIAAIHAGKGFDTVQNGVHRVLNGRGNHAVVITDLRKTKGTRRYLTDNSWGWDWGDGGRGWLVWDHFEQCFNTHAFYLVPTTLTK